MMDWLEAKITSVWSFPSSAFGARREFSLGVEIWLWRSLGMKWLPFVIQTSEALLYFIPPASKTNCLTWTIAFAHTDCTEIYTLEITPHGKQGLLLFGSVMLHIYNTWIFIPLVELSVCNHQWFNWWYTEIMLQIRHRIIIKCFQGNLIEPSGSASVMYFWTTGICFAHYHFQCIPSWTHPEFGAPKQGSSALSSH